MKPPIRKLKPTRTLLHKQLEKIKFEAHGLHPAVQKYLSKLVSNEVAKENTTLAGQNKRLQKRSRERLLKQLDTVITLAAVNEAITHLIEHPAKSHAPKDVQVDPTELKAAVADLETNTQIEINLRSTHE